MKIDSGYGQRRQLHIYKKYSINNLNKIDTSHFDSKIPIQS